MSNYTKLVNYAAKDALSLGDPDKKILGTQLGAEFDAIAVAIATKSDESTGSFTATMTGCTAVLTFTFNYVKTSREVFLQAQFAAAFTGTSNSTSLTITGIPGGILTPNLTPAGFQSLNLVSCLDNGTTISANAYFSSATVITIEALKVSGAFVVPNAAGFTAAGNKGFTSGLTLRYFTAS